MRTLEVSFAFFRWSRTIVIKKQNEVSSTVSDVINLLFSKCQELFLEKIIINLLEELLMQGFGASDRLFYLRFNLFSKWYLLWIKVHISIA